MSIKTFRGLLADGAQKRIRLSTNNGLTGYKIKKLQIIANRPGSSGSDAEHCVQLFSQEQVDATGASLVTNVINFENPLLLAAVTMGNSASAYVYGSTPVIIVDNIKINQDIYITHKETTGAEAVNYYIELEQMKLNTDEATVATLKDMRGRE